MLARDEVVLDLQRKIEGFFGLGILRELEVRIDQIIERVDAILGRAPIGFRDRRASNRQQALCVGKMVTVPFWGCWRYGKSGPAGAAGRGAWMLPYGRRIRSRISLRCFSNMPRLSSSAWSNDSANSEGWPCQARA